MHSTQLHTAPPPNPAPLLLLVREGTDDSRVRTAAEHKGGKRDAVPHNPLLLLLLVHTHPNTCLLLYSHQSHPSSCCCCTRVNVCTTSRHQPPPPQAGRLASCCTGSAVPQRPTHHHWLACTEPPCLATRPPRHAAATGAKCAELLPTGVRPPDAHHSYQRPKTWHTQKRDSLAYSSDAKLSVAVSHRQRDAMRIAWPFFCPSVTWMTSL